MPVMRPWASRRHSGRVSRIVIPTMGPENLPFWMDFTPSLSTVLCVAGLSVLAAAIAGGLRRMKMSASNVVCFETFRQERDSRRSQGREGENVATESAPFQARLAGVLLSARQIEHRRRMLEFGRQLGTTTVAPISRPMAM